jgi:hypothetical protein
LIAAVGDKNDKEKGKDKRARLLALFPLRQLLVVTA